VRAKVPTLFCFGYGLSYTTFDFSDLRVTQPTGSDLSFTATVKVQNTGDVVGSEVVQIYVTPSSTTKLTHPVCALRGYSKAKDVKPGELREVEVKMDKYALSYWCAVQKRWKIEAGTYGVILGRSSEDVLLQAEVKVENETFWDGL
jgi:beta-glucosidase